MNGPPEIQYRDCKKCGDKFLSFYLWLVCGWCTLRAEIKEQRRKEKEAETGGAMNMLRSIHNEV